MIDFGFAAILALICAGVGKRLLDRLGQSPEHPLDAAAMAIPLGMGLLALGILALGELAWLNLVGLSVLLAMMIEVGLVPSVRLLRSLGSSLRAAGVDREHSAWGNGIAVCLGLALIGTAMVALGPVTDGDALCYHLQVPKVFLMRGAVGFLPDLHETVYPLVTEMLYALALEIRGPVACRWIQWSLGLVFALNVTALARPSLGGRAWWAGAIVLLTPAVSNGMAAPLNDVALAAFGTASLFAWTRLQDRPSLAAAIVAGLVAGLAIGVKYPALVLCGLLIPAVGLRFLAPGPRGGAISARRWLLLAVVYAATTATIGGWWYLRAYVHTGNPVYPFFRQAFGGSGLDEVLGAIKRPMPVTPWNLLTALGPLSLHPDRFDSFSHQFGPIFLLFLPALLLKPAPRRVLMLVALGYLFLMICLTQRQSMRFVLIALGPLSIGVAYAASVCCDRRTIASRLIMAALLVALTFESGLAMARCRHGWRVALGRESAEEYLSRLEPTYRVGQWTSRSLPTSARVIGQDHRGFYIPRDYTMELAHRRRTGLGRNGEAPHEVAARLRESGFTHVMLCPPVPESAVEFDPTLGRLLEPWLAGREPVFREDLTDADGVLRRYSIYELTEDRWASQSPGGVTR